MKNNLWNMMQEYQAISQSEDGISFAKEGFTQLYNATIEQQWEYSDKNVKNFCAGLAIGAVTTGLTSIGLYAVNKIHKRKKKDITEED